jgi:outer membrane receptor protein involved in Fe transport
MPIRMLSAFVTCLLSVCILAASAAAQSVRIDGTVRDSSGAAVAGAQVLLQTGPFSATHNTDAQGNFVFDAVPGNRGTVVVRAKGFGRLEQEWSSSGTGVKLDLTLSPATVSEQIMVTATRTGARLGDLAVSAVALNDQDLSATPALVTDDKLRQIPGFTLFRRTGSRTANPTTLGVSLSGLGASGASRALVLEDGVPLNDPFGGWVYWGRVPQEGLESIELVRRGISSLYGSDGLGGAIQFIPRLDEGPAFSLETSYGNEQTPDLSLWGGTRRGPWDAAISTDLFHTDGYIPVPDPQRGSVDTVANSEHAAVEVTLGRNFGEHNRIFGRGSFFTESRQNGTVIQNNDTQLAQGVLGANAQSDVLGAFSVRLFGQAQGYDQSFSAVPKPNGAPGRDSEALTNLQHVPAQQAGASVWWSKPVARQTLVAGVETNEVMGWSNEEVFSAVSGLNTADTIAGGRQRTVGVYGQDIVRITPKWILTLGGRFDHWRNYDAEMVRTPITPPGPTTVAPFDERSENAFSPRVSLLHALTSNVSLTVSAYRAFRAPTLNELYRSFRVGSVLTESNADLQAERLTGAEAGANVFAFSHKLNLRGNFFWNDIVNPIANVTLDPNSNPILRQRQNLGRTRSRGVELDAVARLSSKMEISGGYQFVDATVVSFPADPAANPSLVGDQIPQIPQHQFTLQARYWDPSRLMLSVQGRFVGNQFDDDLNTFQLDRYFAVDLLVGRSLGHGVEVFGAAENVFNTRYTVALTPTPSLGPPVLARIGVRFNFPAHH